MASKAIAVILNLRDQFTPSIKKIAQETGKTEKQIKAAANTVKQFQRQVSNNFKAVGIAAGAMAVSAGVGAIALATQTAEATDRIDELSQQIGMSRKSFQEWEFILAQNGVEIESLKKTYKTLAVEVIKANTGNKDAKKTFKELGINIRDNSGHLKSQDQLYEDVIKSLQGMDDGVKKTVLAYKLLGKGGGDLKPILNSTAEDINKLKKQARDLGIILDDKTINAGAKFADSMEVMRRAVAAIGFNIGGQLIPQLTEVITVIQANMPQIRAVVGQTFGMISSPIKFLVKNMNLIIPVAATLFGLFMGFKAIIIASEAIIYYDKVMKSAAVTQGLWSALMIENKAIQTLSAAWTIISANAVNLWTVATAGATGAQGLFNAALFITRVALAGLGIGLLIAGLVLVVQNWDKITEATTRAIKKAKEYFNVGTGVDLETSAVKGYDYDAKTGKYVKQKTPAHALGTAYFGGGRTGINEGGRGETAILPNGTQIIPHDVAKKSGGGLTINLGGVHIAGNVIGNTDFADYVGQHITSKIKLALANS